MTIILPAQLEERLKAEAAKRGLDVSSYAVELIDHALPASADIDKTLAWLRQWEKDNATDDPEEIARREKEAEEFMQSLNRTRLEMEGPNARKIWP